MKTKKYCREYNKKYYQKNREQLLKQRREYRKEYDKKRRIYLRKLVNNIKLKSGCQICGYNKCVDALVFHHKNPDEKDRAMAGCLRNYGKKRILNEIKKCIVLCMNCHQELHFKLRNKE